MTYTYNNLNQLTNISEQITGAESTTTKNTAFTYDANGNTLSKRTYGQDDEEVVQYTYNPLNQLTEFEDAEGNVTTYAYDGTGMRVSKTQGTNVQRFYWDRGYIVNESLNGTFTASNSVGSQGVFARTTGSGENAKTNFLFKNAHGDVTDIVSDDEVTNEYEYDAYGNQKELSANDTNPFRYCGEYYDEESGLIYLRNRYYDSEIGRFITEDPIQDGMNWYAYCGNNPVMFVDPWGFEGIVVSGGKYSDNSGYQYEFIEPALAKINEWRNNGYDESITWFIAMAGWSDNDFNDFKQAVSNIKKVNVIAMYDIDYLTNYIDSKNIYNSTLSSNRINDKITKFVIFSHGLSNNGGTIELGYHFSNSESLVLDKDDILKLNEQSFKNTNSAFYSCNTGTAGNNSFAQLWANKTNGNTWAFDGQSYYGDINVGNTMASKIAHRMGGFYSKGSKNLPVAGKEMRSDGTYPRFVLFSSMG